MSECICTVIIPYYNTDPAVFERCMSSLVQIDSRVQVLIVDDGSDEPNAAAIEKYAGKQVEILRQKNAGVSSARNRGLQAARGKYVLFLDSDDRAGEGFPLAVCALAERLGVQVLISDITLMPEGKRQSTGFAKNQVMSGEALVQTGTDVFRSYDLCYSVRMCFDREWLMGQNLRFREDMTVSEDLVLNLQALSRAERAAAVPESFYEYWLDIPDSATRNPIKPGYARSLAVQYEQCRAFVGEKESLARQLALFYMDIAFPALMASEKAAGALTFSRYRELCQSPMFRQSIRLLGNRHPCDNPRAQLLYRLRRAGLYRLPYRIFMRQ